MGFDSVSSFLEDNTFQQYQQTETMETAFDDDQLASALGEDFPYPLSAEGDTTSLHQWDFDNVIEQFASTPHISNNNVSSMDHDNIDGNNYNHNITVSSDTDDGSQRSKNKEDDGKYKKTVSGGRKRKRQPSQVQDHIIAERKRRELLGQLFISLSAIVPGLKKMDKTSVLGEAIKHMKHLQEKVKVLEEVAAKRTVESVVVINKSHLIVDNDDSDENDTSSTIDNNCVSGSSGGNLNGSGGGNGAIGAYNSDSSLPEIEVRMTGKTLLLRIYCEVQKGILAKLFTELDKHDMSVTNCSVIPFDSLALDITIVGQMERGFTSNVKDFVKSVRAALRLTTHQCR